MGLGSSLGSAFGGSGAKKAAKYNKKEWERYRVRNKQHYEAISPWATKEYEDGTGVHKASDTLYDLMFGGGDYELSPAGKFAEEQGIKAIQRGASARGMNQSGNVMFDVAGFVTGNAQQDYWQYMSSLMELSGANTSAMSAASANYQSGDIASVEGKNAARMGVAAGRSMQFAGAGAAFDQVASATYAGATGGGNGTFFSSLFG